MNGLIYKDFVNLKQQGKVLALVVGIWTVVCAIEGSPYFLGGILSIFSGLLPLAAYAFDERSGWDKYALTMPVSRRQIVLSKYVLGVLGLSAGLMLSMAVAFLMKRETGEILVTHCAFLAIGLVAVSVLLPLSFKFGTEKARFILMFLYVIPMLLITFLKGISIPMPDEATLNLLICLAPVSALCLFAVSAYVSVQIYTRKEF